MPAAGSAFAVNPSDIRLHSDGTLEVDPATNALRTKTKIGTGFSGLVARDHTPSVGVTYDAGETTLLTIDVGTDSHLVPARWEVPVVIGLIRPVVVVVFHDGSSVRDENATGVDIVRSSQDVLDLVLGGVGAAAANDGKSIRKIELRVNNTGVAPGVASVGTFRFRCIVFPRGSGSAP